MAADELFTYVRQPEVEGTSNTVERELRPIAMDRKAGRISKSDAGAERRSILQSLLASLARHFVPSLPVFIEQIKAALNHGQGFFSRMRSSIVGLFDDLGLPNCNVGDVIEIVRQHFEPKPKPS